MGTSAEKPFRFARQTEPCRTSTTGAAIAQGLRRACWLLLWLLAWAGLPQACLAQQYPLVYHDQTEGLGNLSVSALAQDPAGYLWVGTSNGLYRYDGSAFVRWGGVEVQGVWALHVAVDGAVWAGTSSGLFRVHAGGVTQVRMKGQSIPFQIHNNLVSAPGGRLLVVSVWHVLEVLPAGLDTWTVRPYFDEKTRASHRELLNVSRVHLARDGTLWLACSEALCRAHGQQVEVLSSPVVTGSARGWSEFYEDRRGDLWLRDANRVLQWPQGASSFIDRTPAQAGGVAGLFLTPIAEDADGRILTRVHAGLARWQGQRWEVIDAHHGLNLLDGVTAVLSDRQGGLWLGTSGYGLVQWQGYRHLEAWTAKDGLNEDVWSFLRDRDGRLHMGTGDGVWRLDTAWQRIAPAGRGPQMHQIGAMAQDASGQLWMADFSGDLWVLPHRAKQPVHVAKMPFIFRMFVDAQGRLWICTQQGLFVIDTAQGERLPRQADGQLNPDPKHGPRVYSGCETGAHTLWFTTDAGPWYWDGQGLQRVALRSPEPAVPPPKAVEVVGCSATTNDAWMQGADTGGLWQIRRNDTAWEAVQVKPPHLANVLVIGLLQDRRGWLWVSTDAGLHVWNGERWRSFNRDNGLVWNDCNQNALYEDADGSIWVGTSRGAQHIARPESLFEPVRRGPPGVSMVRGNAAVNLAAPLAWAGPPLKVSFDSPWYESRRADRFHYRVLGLDETWAVSAGSELTLSSLAPGHYRLEVLTENADQQLRSSVAAVDFDIAAPWWRTTAFYTVGILAMLLLAWALYAWRVRQLAQHQRYLEALVAQRTGELEASREQMRQLALKDALTGVWNRRALMSMLDAELARAEREQQVLTLVIVDADHFKQVNDAHGHLAGDAVLKELASRLQRLTRAYDVVGRYGGEEFLLLLPRLDTSRAEDRQRIEAFHLAISAQPMAMGAGRDILVTCSFGVASVTQGVRVNGEALIAQADAALYRAKDAGRNRIAYGEPVQAR
jgi:diguanylate cyclase (GGDEF)-like protein